MAEPSSKKDLDQVQLEHDTTQPIRANKAGANIVQNPLKVGDLFVHETKADKVATR